MQLANASVFAFAFREVIGARLFVVDPHDQVDMGPTQLATQRVAFFIPGEGQVKLPEIFKVRHRKALAERELPFLGKVFDQFLPIARPFLAMLFFLDNAFTDQKIGIHHGRVYGGVCPASCGFQDLADLIVKD